MVGCVMTVPVTMICVVTMLVVMMVPMFVMVMTMIMTIFMVMVRSMSAIAFTLVTVNISQINHLH